MKHTLLLVFIHGFKGSDDTFEKFPDHLRVLLGDVLPKVNVLSVVYPQYDTRGDLTACVSGFKEWLQDKVIDLEVAAHTPSPTVDPSVRVILVGHSMGGIVAAETLLSIARDQPVPLQTSSTPPPGVGNNTTTAPKKTGLNVPDQQERASSAPPGSRSSKQMPKAQPNTQPTSDPDKGGSDPLEDTPTLLFPRIQGILAFDTPFLGIHPGVIAHGAEAHINTASAAMSAYNQASRFFGGGGKNASAVDASKALPSASEVKSGGWGKYAMYAGGVAAIAAAGGAAYMGRSQLTNGWSWATSHLEFIGCLARGAELVQRVDAVVKLGDRCNVGFADFYGRLGEQKGKTDYSGQLLGQERTFCVVPTEAQGPQGDAESPKKKRKVDQKVKSKGTWIECVNKKADDEIAAHRAMFTPRDYPGYYGMCDRAKDMVASWIDREWYDSSPEEEEGDDQEADLQEDVQAGAEQR